MTEETNATPTVEESVKSGGEAWRTALDETVKLLENLGKAVVTTAQDLSQLMVVQVDEETREHLDLLVEAGAVKSRREGANYLLKAGVEAKRETFARMATTQARIAALRAQLRESVKGLRPA